LECMKAEATYSKVFTEVTTIAACVQISTPHSALSANRPYKG